MLPKRAVKASLAFVPGKYTQEPNVVIVPAGRKTFPVGVEWSMEADQSYVIGSQGPNGGNLWCVLDGNLKQVMSGRSGYAPKSPKKAEAVVGRTIQGGGSSNPRKIDIELTSSGLKSGGSYTLIASRHGVLAAGEFVAVHEPKPKPAARKKAAVKKKAAPKRVGKKK